MEKGIYYLACKNDKKGVYAKKVSGYIIKNNGIHYGAKYNNSCKCWEVTEISTGMLVSTTSSSIENGDAHIVRNLEDIDSYLDSIFTLVSKTIKEHPEFRKRLDDVKNNAIDETKEEEEQKSGKKKLW